MYQRAIRIIGTAAIIADIIIHHIIVLTIIVTVID